MRRLPNRREIVRLFIRGSDRSDIVWRYRHAFAEHAAASAEEGDPAVDDPVAYVDRKLREELRISAAVTRRWRR